MLTFLGLNQGNHAMPLLYNENDKAFLKNVGDAFEMRDQIFKETESFLEGCEKWALEQAQKELEGGEVAHH